MAPSWSGSGRFPPYLFTLESGDRWFRLYEWLKNQAFTALENIPPDRSSLAEHFGLNAPSLQRDIDALRDLYQLNRDRPTIQIKRQLWEDLLRTALGEVARTPGQMDELFVRHSYLTAVIGMVVQASFGIDLRAIAAIEPMSLLDGSRFRDEVGLTAVVESDFFTWPSEEEVGGIPLMQTLARRIARFNWKDAPADVAAILYETVIPPEERRQLGEYYTPDWLASAIVKETVNDPLSQRVLDPACGSGAFIAAAVKHFVEASKQDSATNPRETSTNCGTPSPGSTFTPWQSTLARTAWILAAKPVIEAVVNANLKSDISVPVYLGDALQLRFRTGDMFAEHEVRIQADDTLYTELVFPCEPGQQARHLRRLDGRHIHLHRAGPAHLSARPRHRGRARDTDHGSHHRGHAAAPRRGPQPHLGLLHPKSGTPVALAQRKVNVIVGTTTGSTINQTVSALRTGLEP